MERWECQAEMKPLGSMAYVKEPLWRGGGRMSPARTALGRTAPSVQGVSPSSSRSWLFFRAMAWAAHAQHNLVSLLSLQAGPQRPLSSSLVFGRGPWKVWGRDPLWGLAAD